MKTLIIYDDSGFIYAQTTGNYRIPQGGIRFIEVDVEIYKDKIIKGVNPETKELILENKTPTEVDVLKQQLDENKKLITEIIENKYNTLLNF